MAGNNGIKMRNNSVHLAGGFPFNVQIILVMAEKFYVDPDIKKASTLPASFYREEEVFEAMKSKIFHRSWQLVPPQYIPTQPKSVIPFRLLDGFIAAPLLMSKDESGKTHCLSNVCTHRGNLLVAGSTKVKKLVCGYHGRRFSLDGAFEFMPEFEETEDFPSSCDHLPGFPLVNWGPLCFTSLDAAFNLNRVFEIMEARLGFLPIRELHLAGDGFRTYEVKAHWALYCDNYLEGFHIPFVHKELDAILDYGQYDTLLFDQGCLQVGYSASHSEAIFKLPSGHVDYGKSVAAYYYWVFPNLMFNFYPWGLSLNVVMPVNNGLTRVVFASFVWDQSKMGKGAGSGLHRVELEDEAVVEGVQQGLQSGLYTSGRFSPKREQGVHHFHRILADYLNT
jgi:choline monooxygenase